MASAINSRADFAGIDGCTISRLGSNTLTVSSNSTAGGGRGGGGFAALLGGGGATGTTTGTKTVLFAGTLSFGNNQDLLLLPVAKDTAPARVKMLVVIEGAGNRQISELTDTP